MSKGLPRSLSRAEPLLQNIVKLDIPVRGLEIAVADGAPGFGTAVIQGLPAGNLLFLGAVAYLQFATTDVDVIDAFEGDFSIGTVATVDGDLADAGEADIVPSTAIAAATDQISPVTRGASTDALGGGILDNTDGSLELNLNLLIDDTSIGGAATFTADGVVHLALVVLGDD